MVNSPADTPVNVPVAGFTEAIEASLEVHVPVPEGKPAVTCEESPLHTEKPWLSQDGAGFTVRKNVSEQCPKV